MNRHDERLEDLDRDPVWELLRRSPAARASGRFVDDVMRSVRLGGVPKRSWWSRWSMPLGIGGLAAAASAVVLGWSLWSPKPAGNGGAALTDLSELDAVAEEEMLVAAADHLASFSDDELVTMLGF